MNISNLTWCIIITMSYSQFSFSRDEKQKKHPVGKLYILCFIIASSLFSLNLSEEVVLSLDNHTIITYCWLINIATNNCKSYQWNFSKWVDRIHTLCQEEYPPLKMTSTSVCQPVFLFKQINCTSAICEPTEKQIWWYCISVTPLRNMTIFLNSC